MLRINPETIFFSLGKSQSVRAEIKALDFKVKFYTYSKRHFQTTCWKCYSLSFLGAKETDRAK